MIEQFWTHDGKLVAENDPNAGYEFKQLQERAEALLKSKNAELAELAQRARVSEAISADIERERDSLRVELNELHKISKEITNQRDKLQSELNELRKRKDAAKDPIGDGLCNVFLDWQNEHPTAEMYDAFKAGWGAAHCPNDQPVK